MRSSLNRQLQSFRCPQFPIAPTCCVLSPPGCFHQRPHRDPERTHLGTRPCRPFHEPLSVGPHLPQRHCWYYPHHVLLRLLSSADFLRWHGPQIDSRLSQSYSNGSVGPWNGTIWCTCVAVIVYPFLWHSKHSGSTSSFRFLSFSHRLPYPRCCLVPRCLLRSHPVFCRLPHRLHVLVAGSYIPEHPVTEHSRLV